MRVSKTVREYIEKQVTAKMEQKYASLIAAEKEQDNTKDKVNNDIRDKVVQFIFNEIELATNTYPFLWSRYDNYEDIYKSMKYNLPASVCVRRECPTRQKMRDEAYEIIQNIIVELELGGSKADLERMLAEIS